MDYTAILLLLSYPLSFPCIIIILSFLYNQMICKHCAKLPPGPSPYPIIGNILELGAKPHHSLTNLSKIYGPLMTLKLGSITTIVISSPNIAKEALQKNDLVFSGRMVPHTVQTLDHHKVSVAFVHPSSLQWKTLRRVCVTKMFSSVQLDSTQNLRCEKLQDLLEYVNQCCCKGEALDIGEAVFVTTLNSISSTLFSIDLAGFASDSSREFKDIISGIFEEAGSPNISDFFPFLRLLDLQCKRSRMDSYCSKIFKFIDDIIGERIHHRALKGASKVYHHDVLDSFLSLMEEDNAQLKRFDVVHLLMALFFLAILVGTIQRINDLFGRCSFESIIIDVKGVDTTSITVEWTMSELLKSPEKIGKLRKELEQVIGKDTKLEESHISKLPFLRAVVKEALRLHPPAPFLLPRMALDNAEICGFTVPKNAQVIVNIWAIGRDSSVWTDPNLFVPERFFESKVDFKGRDFELIPFGAGRRMCPGQSLASRAVHLIGATLVQTHDWKLPDGLQPNDLEMDDKFGLTLKKVHPLRAIPTPAP